jgi:hypothetical protein
MNKPAILALLSLSLTACAAPTQYHAASEPGSGVAIVEIHNDSPHNVDVYMVRGAFPVRIGSVPAQRSGALRLPRAYLGTENIAIEARAFASGEAYRSAPMLIMPGDRITLQVLSPIALSSLVMRTSGW